MRCRWWCRPRRTERREWLRPRFVHTRVDYFRMACHPGTITKATKPGTSTASRLRDRLCASTGLLMDFWTSDGLAVYRFCAYFGDLVRNPLSIYSSLQPLSGRSARFYLEHTPPHESAHASCGFPK